MTTPCSNNTTRQPITNTQQQQSTQEASPRPAEFAGGALGLGEYSSFKSVDIMLIGSLAVTRPTCAETTLQALDLPQKMMDRFLAQSEVEESVAWFSKNCTRE